MSDEVGGRAVGCVVGLLGAVLSASIFTVTSMTLRTRLPTGMRDFPIESIQLATDPFGRTRSVSVHCLLKVSPSHLLTPCLGRTNLSPGTRGCAG